MKCSPLEERCIHKQLGYATFHMHCDMQIPVSQIDIDRKNKILKMRREVETVAKTEDDSLKYQKKRPFENQYQSPADNR